MSRNDPDPDWREVVEARERMHAGGWRVVPVCEARKAPLFSEWPSYVYDPRNPEPPVPRTRSRDGLPTRAVHRGTGAITLGLVALDIDIDDAARASAARIAFEITAGENAPLARYRKRADRRMLLYAAENGQNGVSLSIGDDANGKIELFAGHPGRQVFLLGRHPSGQVLRYEGDSPPDWPVHELPVLSECRFRRAYGAALEAANIPVPTVKTKQGESVRRQTSDASAAEALGEQIRRLVTGESVHRASNAVADLLAFQVGLDGEQIGQVLAALARTGRALSPQNAARYDELITKSASRGAWYAERTEMAPDAPARQLFWAEARAEQLKRAWRVLPDHLRQSFLDAALAQRGGGHG